MPLTSRDCILNSLLINRKQNFQFTDVVSKLRSCPKTQRLFLHYHVWLKYTLTPYWAHLQWMLRQNNHGRTAFLLEGNFGSRFNMTIRSQLTYYSCSNYRPGDMITLLEDSNEDWWKVCASHFISVFFPKGKISCFQYWICIKAATVNYLLLSICFLHRGELMTELDFFLLTLFRECNKMRRFTGVSGHSLAARNRDR